MQSPVAMKSWSFSGTLLIISLLQYSNKVASNVLRQMAMRQVCCSHAKPIATDLKVSDDTRVKVNLMIKINAKNQDQMN